MPHADTVLEASRLLLGASVKGSALIVLVVLIQWIGRGKIPAGWRYALWLVVIARLLLPVAPESRFSLFAPDGSGEMTMQHMDGAKLEIQVHKK
jgi:beta-lactamase regulating signal transducer with metallopeptidase domain